MGRKNRSKKIADPGKAEDFKVNPFAGIKIDVPKDEPPPPPPKPKVGEGKRVPVDPELAAAFGGGAGKDPLFGQITYSRLRFSIERKGHGGKTVTIVRGLQHLDVLAQMELLRAARQSLGVGGRFEEGVLELQGDQRERARAWLAEKTQ